MQTCRIQPDFESWRMAARRLLVENVAPDQVVWVQTHESGLFGEAGPPQPATAPLENLRVPPQFMQLARLVAFHRDAGRWALLYRLLWRLTHGEPNLLKIETDDDVLAANAMAKHVKRDRHKMHAFVRFRKVAGAEGEHYVAWHRPDHPIVKLAAPFFQDRFGAMRWTILTPDESVTWDGHELRYGPGVPRRLAPQPDELEDLWKRYYANIFNPARINLSAMRAEMPKKHWATMPETEILSEMLADAPRRVELMMAQTRQPQTTAADYLPETRRLDVMADAIQKCRGCELYKEATQAVFGEGDPNAKTVFVGEVPGDQEDLAGKPFIGPAGQLLDDLLERAGVDRQQVYVTNTVKHFKFERRGKRRLHVKPSAREITACVPWLEAEIQAVRPQVLVCLGATAAQAIFGRDFRITRDRGQPRKTDWAPFTLATLHPSALLRIPDDQGRELAKEDFVADMRLVAAEMRRVG